jgi:hypothetical protein
VLLTDQSTRQYSNLKPFNSNYNISDGTNTVTSNTLLSNRINPSPTLLNNYFSSNTNYIDRLTTNHLLTNSFFMDGSYPGTLSNNPYISKLDHTNMLQKNISIETLKNSVSVQIKNEKLNSVDLLGGPREKAPSPINSNY